MQQNAGTLLLNGVVQISASYVGNNTIPQNEVAGFMKGISQALVECLIEANRGFAGEPLQQALPSQPPRVAAIAAPVAPAAAPAPAAVPAVAEAAASEAPRAVAQVPVPAAAAPPQPEVATAVEPVVAAAEEPQGSESAEGPLSVAERFKDLSNEPKVPISKSITPDGIICLFDGQPRKMLHRHILAKYGMTPEEYREFWGLPPDYPMTAPSYSAEKRIVAKAQGLGTSKLYDGVNARKAEAERLAAEAKAAKSSKKGGGAKAPAARKSRAKQVA